MSRIQLHYLPGSGQPPNGGVNAAARFHSTIAGPIMMRNTLPPLASNDLFDRVDIISANGSKIESRLSGRLR
jgi:hypothetical protein